MTRWRIELRDTRGERDGGTLIVDADNLVKAKRHALRVCRRHLSVNGDVYFEARGHQTYGVVLEQEKVGEVRITRLKSGRPDAPSALRVLTREPRGRRGALGRAGTGARRGAEPVPPWYLDGGRKEMI